MPVRTAYDPAAGEVATSTNLERLAGGWIGYAENTAGTSFTTSVSDLSGLSVAVTVNPSRRIRITGSFDGLQSSAASSAAELRIYEGATQLGRAVYSLAVGDWARFYATVIITPSSGAHTYKLSGINSGGTTTVSASATDPAYILVEDLGPA